MSSTRSSHQSATGSRLSCPARCTRDRAVEGARRHDLPRAHVRRREGGSVRISLTYDAATEVGKTTEHTDTYRGRFVKLVPNEQIIEVDEFETSNPALRGAMAITITLADRDGGTDLHAVHDGLPPGVPPDDNEIGWQMALAKLAALVEADWRSSGGPGGRL